MASVSLELFKQHVRADDFADDDLYLQHLLDTAETAIVNEIYGGNPPYPVFLEDAPLPLQHAVMMLAAHWYNQRESVSTAQMHEVPGTLQALIKPYRKFDVGSDAVPE